jgi:hypothetical protein
MALLNVTIMPSALMGVIGIERWVWMGHDVKKKRLAETERKANRRWKS